MNILESVRSEEQNDCSWKRLPFVNLSKTKTEAKNLNYECHYNEPRCLCHAHLVGIMGVNYPGQPKVTDLEQELVRVDENVGRLQVSVQDVGWVDEL